MPRAVRDDFLAIKARDPAAQGFWSRLLCYPGFHALCTHRVCHRMWISDMKLGGRLLSQFARLMTGVEIHPGAVIGKGVFIDHGMGVVIGETAEVGDGCLLYQGVTLGGTGKESGKRHPTLERNVVVGAGAKILGSIRVGENTRIGAGSVVLKDIPSESTVVGVPGRVIHSSKVRSSPLEHSELPDQMGVIIQRLMKRIDRLEVELDYAKEWMKRTSGDEMDIESDVGEAQNLNDREVITFFGDEVQ